MPPATTKQPKKKFRIFRNPFVNKKTTTTTNARQASTKGVDNTKGDAPIIQTIQTSTTLDSPLSSNNNNTNTPRSLEHFDLQQSPTNDEILSFATTTRHPTSLSVKREGNIESSYLQLSFVAANEDDDDVISELTTPNAFKTKQHKRRPWQQKLPPTAVDLDDDVSTTGDDFSTATPPTMLDRTAVLLVQKGTDVSNINGPVVEIDEDSVFENLDQEEKKVVVDKPKVPLAPKSLILDGMDTPPEDKPKKQVETDEPKKQEKEKFEPLKVPLPPKSLMLDGFNKPEDKPEKDGKEKFEPFKEEQKEVDKYAVLEEEEEEEPGVAATEPIIVETVSESSSVEAEPFFSFQEEIRWPHQAELNTSATGEVEVQVVESVPDPGSVSESIMQEIAFREANPPELVASSGDDESSGPDLDNTDALRERALSPLLDSVLDQLESELSVEKKTKKELQQPWVTDRSLRDESFDSSMHSSSVDRSSMLSDETGSLQSHGSSSVAEVDDDETASVKGFGQEVGAMMSEIRQSGGKVVMEWLDFR